MNDANAALITGASAGLGTEFAKLFARDKHDLVLVARRRDRLEALAQELSKAHGVKAYAVAADLGAPDGPRRALDETRRLGLQIGYLVNNAGFGTTGPFAELDPARELEMVQVNIVALMTLTRELLPPMIQRKRGRILNIGSTAGFQPGPFMAVYYASKAFVNSFTEALAFELAGSGVTATVSCPGATATEFSKVAGTERSRLFQMGAMSASEVAEHAYRAMLAGKSLVIPGVRNKLGLQIQRISPRGVVRGVAARLNKDGN